jgi:putative flippase GtrA
MINKFFSTQFLLFVIAGGVSMIFNLGSRIVYSRWLDFSYAVFFAYLTGMLMAFLLFKFFVFNKSNQSTQNSVMLFVLVNLVGMLQTLLISLWLVHYLLPLLGVTSYQEEIAHTIGLGSTVITSYIGHKHWSFR